MPLPFLYQKKSVTFILKNTDVTSPEVFFNSPGLPRRLSSCISNYTLLYTLL